MEIALNNKEIFDKKFYTKLTNVINENLNYLKRNKMYNIEISFYNEINDNIDISLVDFDINYVKKIKKFHDKSQKIRKLFLKFNIGINNIKFIGTNNEKLKNKISFSFKESNNISEKNTKIILSKEYFLFKNNLIYLDKLYNKDLISENEYKETIRDFKKEYKIPNDIKVTI
ncbi:MAG: hypothetical protein FH751_11130 [Firmicutes bacterium]|nr:hypothetical protein [Bacillota bacterium]